jgi:hypothetical protein
MTWKQRDFAIQTIGSKALIAITLYTFVMLLFCDLLGLRANAFETGFNFSRTRVTQTESGKSNYRFLGGRITEMQMLRPLFESRIVDKKLDVVRPC